MYGSGARFGENNNFVYLSDRRIFSLKFKTLPMTISTLGPKVYNRQKTFKSLGIYIDSTAFNVAH